MFKKSEASSNPDLFSNVNQHLGEKKINKLEDPKLWHNSFFNEIICRVDETIFAPMYCNGNGRPNSSIRRLVGMMILKEGQDWTDEQLFESSNFNLLVMRALGLNNLSDEPPSPATYYNFKVALLKHEQQTGKNLLSEVFQSLTKDQIIEYKVSGTHVRMDSKLIHSNIAKTTRLQLCLGVLKKFHKSLNDAELELLNTDQAGILKKLSEKSVEQYTYRLNKEKASIELQKIGGLIYKLLKLYETKTSEQYLLMKRLWEENFEWEDSSKQSGEPTAKSMKGKGGSNLQSAFDSQATYRNKPGAKKQLIKGYVSNITETCLPNSKEDKGNSSSKKVVELRLITNVQTQPATTSDDKFFKPGIEKSQQILDDQIENVLTDGAYNSSSNNELTQDEDHPFEWYLTGIQGSEGYYDFNKNKDDSYTVTDKRTGLKQETILTNSGKYRIVEHHANNKYRYFNLKTINNYFRRLAMEKYPDWVYGLRANAESTIYQVFCKLDGLKSKYRGLFQNHNYALSRSFWVNFKRINAFNQ